MYELIKNTQSILSDSPDIDSLEFMTAIDKLYSLSQSRPRQIPVRIVRSTIYRLLLAIYQQRNTIRSSSESLVPIFTQRALTELSQMLYYIELEFYSICDYVEKSLDNFKSNIAYLSAINKKYS